MDELALASRRRECFVDDRASVRRMQVSRHPDQGLVIVSLWHGDTCTGSFRLPVADAGRLVQLLVSAMCDQLRSKGSAPGRTEQVRTGLSALRQRLSALRLPGPRNPPGR